mgnify:CR=1 FL=1
MRVGGGKRGGWGAVVEVGMPRWRGEGGGVGGGRPVASYAKGPGRGEAMGLASCLSGSGGRVCCTGRSVNMDLPLVGAATPLLPMA